MTVVDRSSKKLDIPTVVQEVSDITGAGDTVVAALSLALAAAEPIDSALRFANLAAGIVVSKVGTSTVSPEEMNTHQAALQL